MVDLDAVKKILSAQRIELPSWAFGNSGTRFKVFGQRGVPRNPFEKVADAARVHLHTGVAPTVALHIPWDRVDSFAALGKAAADVGITLGTVNANVFQDDDYMLGSVTNPDPRVRAKAVAHLLECVDVMDETGSRDLKLWFSDGTNYPGQDNIRARQDRLEQALATVYGRLSGDQRIILEYKLFEPAFYTMDVPDWGTSYAHCLTLGERAKVCVDTGHHAPGTNIEFIVAFLMRAGKLGAFDFNSRFYADDDLIVGAADPFQLFRILFEVVIAGGLDTDSEIAFMLDQCHNIEPKIPGQIRSVMNVQEATAKALLVDIPALEAAQMAGDVLGANAVVMNAYNTDVRELLGDLREEQGLARDPMVAYAASGYAEQITMDRVGANRPAGAPETWLGYVTDYGPISSEGKHDMAQFDGRRILVTGAGGAIGGAIVRRLSADGAIVLAAGLSALELAAIVEQTGAVPIPFDLTSEESIRNAIEGLDLYGVVNCGGWGGAFATPQDTDIDVFDKVISINTRGALLVTKYAARSMIRLGKGGVIVNVSSQAALIALPGHISYASSKAALDSITRSSALELGKYGIRVNSVNPTVVMSQMSVGYWGQPEIEGPFLEAMPLGRWATEDDIAAPIVFLLSEDAGMITGVSLPIDGGYTIR